MTDPTRANSKTTFVVGPGAVDGQEAGLLYFGYGSNLSSTQMCSRCPGSEAVGLAFLPGYRFIINERGFANVLPVKTTTPSVADEADKPSKPQEEPPRVQETTASRHMDEQGVYGIVYRLGDGDEDLLDGFEGVLTGNYAKEMRTVELLTSTGEWQEKPALVYIDGLRVSEDVPRREYIARMNRGVDEAKREWGLPQGYIDDVIRRFIPSAPKF